MLKIKKNIPVLYIILSFLVIQTAFSQENFNNLTEKKYTNSQINVGLAFGEDFYLSDFFELPGILTCCGYDNISYKFGTGFGYSFWLGYGRNLPKLLFNKDFLFNTNIKFFNQSGKFSEEIKIGNKIYENRYEDIISEHSLDVDLYALSLNPSLSIYLFDKENLPLNLNFGLNFGVLLNGKFSQKEELISPENEFFANGTKFQNVADGNLPNQSNFFAGISLGIAYDWLHFGNFVLSPTFNLNYNFTNVISDLNWKTHSANLGINVTYKIPERKIPEEKTPEPPIIPEFPQLKTPLTEKLNLIVNANEPNNSTIKIPIYASEITNVSSDLPMIYFEQNSGKIIEGYPQNLIFSLKNRRNLKIEIGISSSENEAIFNVRKKEILNFLNANKIDTNSIIFEKNHIAKKARYSEIEKENSYAKFFINNKFEQLLSENRDTIINEIGNKNINFETKITATSLPYLYQFNYIVKQNSQNNIEKTINNEEKIELKIDDNLLNWKNEFTKNKKIEKAEIDIQCKVVDAEQKSATENFKYEIMSEFFIGNFHNSSQENSYNSEFLLGFFSFDEAEIFATNEKVLSEIKNSLKSNKKVEIFATTDNLGMQNYNSNLSSQRAKSAIAIIDPENKYSNNISIGSRNEIEKRFVNSTTYSRQKSRIVVVRILK